MINKRMAMVLVVSVTSVAGSWACSSSSNPATPGGTGGDASSTSSTSTSSTPSTHASTTSSNATATNGTGGSGSFANLGLGCTEDSDCGAPLTCILPTANDAIFGGGPAGGYCSHTCSVDTDCGDAGSCLLPSMGTTGDCVASCMQGPALMHINDLLDPTKCSGRDDARCAPINNDGTLFGCLPTCGEDSQCPPGDACDQSSSVCVPSASASTGLPAGSACDPNAIPSQCAGTCVSFSSADPDAGAPATLCSDACVLGGDVLTSPNCGGLAKGICLFSASGNGAGDNGFCAPSCSSQNDCQTPDFWCFPISGLTGNSPGQVPYGWCMGATPCPNGAADCASEAGTLCTTTKTGPFCLSTMFPIGGADAGGGGAGGGG